MITTLNIYTNLIKPSEEDVYNKKFYVTKNLKSLMSCGELTEILGIFSLKLLKAAFLMIGRIRGNSLDDVRIWSPHMKKDLLSAFVERTSIQ